MKLQKNFFFVVVTVCVLFGIKMLLDDLNISSPARHQKAVLLKIGVKENGNPRQEFQRQHDFRNEESNEGDVRVAILEPREEPSVPPTYLGSPSESTPLARPDINVLKRVYTSKTPLENRLRNSFHDDDFEKKGGKNSSSGTKVMSEDEGAPRLGSASRNLSQALYKLAPQIFDGVPEQFLIKFKNPCWWNRHSISGRPDMALTGTTSTLRCMPYFFLAGMPKAGTTDLYAKLHGHPQVIKTTVKEPHWWTRHRFHGVSLKMYLNKQSINIAPRLKNGPDPNIIIGDSSASTLWDIIEWRRLSHTSDIQPPHILSEIIGTILPDARFIVILRDPVDRLYSDFNYFNSYDYHKGPSIFHDYVMKFIAKFQSCLRKPLDYRTCTYALQNETRTRMSLGMYSIYLRDWLKVFPSDQFKVLRLEDWHANCTSILPKLYDFLQLRRLDNLEIARICSQRSSNVNRRQVKPMLQKTRQILTDFYLPSKIDLANLLRDDRYLWNDRIRGVHLSTLQAEF